MRRILMLFALLAVATMAHAATSAPGFNLRWDQCYADGGAWNKNFACDTNTGTERLVASFELVSPITDMNAIEASLDLSAASATLPAWWQMKNAQTCRQASLGFSAVSPAGSVLCPDWSGGQGSGGIASYTIGVNDHGVFPNRSRLFISAAVPPTNQASLDPDQEYFAFSITINHAKTVGTGSCGGCQTPVVIYLSSMTLLSAQASATLHLGRGANYEGSAYASWQSGYPVNVEHYCSRRGVFTPPDCALFGTSFTCVLATPTNSHGSTWGAVKSLYR